MRKCKDDRSLDATCRTIKRVMRCIPESATVTFVVDTALNTSAFKLQNNFGGPDAVPYTRPNTGNHTDHPPVPGGYRGATVDGQLVVLGEGRALQVINPGLATEAVIDVPAGLEGRE